MWILMKQACRAVAALEVLPVCFVLAPLSASAASAPTFVTITVDVESWDAGDPGIQVWGVTPASLEAHGIGKIMDILESRGVRGTFFLNAYEAAEHGEIQLAEIARAIHARGHDLQLHSHPGGTYGVHRLARADLQQQLEILEEGKHLILEWTGKQVIAHRAGGFHADLTTLDACRLAGLAVDASLSPASPHTELAQLLPPHNEPLMLRGILELPVTHYTQAKIGSWRSLRIVDLEASTLAELKEIIRQARSHGLPLVNILMHSFSFVRYGEPDIDLERRFEKLLDFLTSEPEIQPITVSRFYVGFHRHGTPPVQNLSPPALT